MPLPLLPLVEAAFCFLAYKKAKMPATVLELGCL
jgi:hypothetical protein